MNPVDSSPESEGSAVGVERGEAGTARAYLSKAPEPVRRFVESGGFVGIGGAMSLLQGLRSLRRGERARGLARLALGGLLVALALAQRRWSESRDAAQTGVDETDGVSTGPDVGGVAETDSEDEPHLGGEIARNVAETSIDIEGVTETEPDTDESAMETETDTDESATEVETDESPIDRSDTTENELDESGLESAVSEGDSYERLGEAAFNEHKNEVPAPQRAFDVEFLALDAEAFWGVREADDAVLLSQLYDPLQERDGVRYVGSSEIDEERTLKVPSAVLNHWDDVAGGGTAVVSGDELVFATSEDLEADSLLLVVPERWVDDVLGEEE